MKKRKKHGYTGSPGRPTNTHFENLIDLRETNPAAFARLGEGPNQAVERYEVEQLASEFEHREGTEKLLELRDRLPAVFARFTDETKRLVERYAERKSAFETVSESAKHRS